MQPLLKNELVGFLELQVGSMAVQVPIRQDKSSETLDRSLPLVTFETEGDAYAILIRGDSPPRAVEKAVAEAAKQALAHLSRKLLN